MRKKLIQIVVISILLGIIITFITGLFLNQEDKLIGATRWGYPLHWLSKPVVVSPPLNILWLNLLIDILIWSIIFLLILVIIFSKNLFKKEEKVK